MESTCRHRSMRRGLLAWRTMRGQLRKHGVEVNNFGDACACDVEAYAKFFQVMLENGIYLPPSQYEAWFVGLAHDAGAIEEARGGSEQFWRCLRVRCGGVC